MGEEMWRPYWEISESVTSHSLPGFLGKSKTTERKRPLERRGKKRNSFFCYMTVIMGVKKNI